MKKINRFVSAKKFIAFYNSFAKLLNDGYRLHDVGTSVAGLKRSGIYPQAVCSSDGEEDIFIYNEDDILEYVKKAKDSAIPYMPARAAVMNRALIYCDHLNVENLFAETREDGCIHKSFFKDIKDYVDIRTRIAPYDLEKLAIISTFEEMKSALSGRHDQEYIIVSRDAVSKALDRMQSALEGKATKGYAA